MGEIALGRVEVTTTYPKGDPRATHVGVNGYEDGMLGTVCKQWVAKERVAWSVPEATCEACRAPYPKWFLSGQPIPIQESPVHA